MTIGSESRRRQGLTLRIDFIFEGHHLRSRRLCIRLELLNHDEIQVGVVLGWYGSLETVKSGRGEIRKVMINC